MSRSGTAGGVLVSLLISSVCSQIPGIVRALGLVFKRNARAGPGWIFSVPLWVCSVGRSKQRIPRRSLVSSLQPPERATSVGHGFEDDRKSFGDVGATSPPFRPLRAHRVERHPLDSALRYRPGIRCSSSRRSGACIQRKEAIQGSCAAMRRMRGLTVKVTSTSVVERRLAIDGAERAIIMGLIEVLERRARLDDTAA